MSFEATAGRSDFLSVLLIDDKYVAVYHPRQDLR